MDSIISIIEKETSGKSFMSHKFCHDTKDFGGIIYDPSQEIVWKAYGETERHKSSIDLTDYSLKRMSYPSIFSFFLDGSRHTYKVDDISYKKNVYPILAGQVGVGCCQRIGNKLIPALPFDRKLVIALPNKAFSSDAWEERDRANSLLMQINKEMSVKNKPTFSQILIYDTNKDDSYEKKGIACIQDYMVETEKQIVAELVTQGKVNADNYLIKDGSLDYQRVAKTKNKNAINLSEKHIANYYQYVVGKVEALIQTL